MEWDTVERALMNIWDNPNTHLMYKLNASRSYVETACKYERQDARKYARNNRCYEAMKTARDVQDGNVWKTYLACEQQRVDSHVRECESILRRKMADVIEFQRQKWYAREREERRSKGFYVAKRK